MLNYYTMLRKIKLVAILNSMYIVDAQSIALTRTWKKCHRFAQYVLACKTSTQLSFFECYSIPIYINDVVYNCFNMEYDFVLVIVQKNYR